MKEDILAETINSRSRQVQVVLFMLQEETHNESALHIMYMYVYTTYRKTQRNMDTVLNFSKGSPHSAHTHVHTHSLIHTQEYKHRFELGYIHTYCGGFDLGCCSCLCCCSSTNGQLTSSDRNGNPSRGLDTQHLWCMVKIWDRAALGLNPLVHLMSAKPLLVTLFTSFL